MLRSSRVLEAFRNSSGASKCGSHRTEELKRREVRNLTISRFHSQNFNFPKKRQGSLPCLVCMN